jgi:hypothetical protein
MPAGPDDRAPAPCRPGRARRQPSGRGGNQDGARPGRRAEQPSRRACHQGLDSGSNARLGGPRICANSREIGLRGAQESGWRGRWIRANAATPQSARVLHANSGTEPIRDHLCCIAKVVITHLSHSRQAYGCLSEPQDTIPAPHQRGRTLPPAAPPQASNLTPPADPGSAGLHRFPQISALCKHHQKRTLHLQEAVRL